MASAHHRVCEDNWATEDAEIGFLPSGDTGPYDVLQTARQERSHGATDKEMAVIS